MHYIYIYIYFCSYSLVCLLIGLRDPTFLCQQTMTPQTFCPGGCIMFVCRPGVAGCPRRLTNKKLTKSYTRYPVVVLGGPVRRSL